MNSKGAIQVDFVIAASLFIVIFAFVVISLTNYISTIRIQTNSLGIKAEAFSLLDLTERNFSPNKIGLGTQIFRFYVIINNSQTHMIDPLKPIGNLTDELVNINFSDYGINKDINSTVIYDENNSLVDYQITSIDNITFLISIQANSVKTYTIYFDDDSNFTSRSVVLSGTDNLTEKVIKPEKINAIQFKSLQVINATNYELTRNSTGVKNNFRIRLVDNTTFFSYGPEPPREGDVVSLQRYVLYQNSTCDINNGLIIVDVFK